MRQEARCVVERLRARRQAKGRPLSIAHRGASAYATENTATAFRRAALLGADMWEVDVRVTRDGVPVACHDERLRRLAGIDDAIADLAWADLAEVKLATGGTVPSLDQVIDLARETGTALYLDLKSPDAGTAALDLLDRRGFDDAVLGERDPARIDRLHHAGCSLPLSILVPVGADPFALASETTLDMIHPCWEHASPTPQNLLTPDFIARAGADDLDIITWHEERPGILADLVALPVLGICSDQPERVQPYRADPAQGRPLICCHRGANTIAPENTLAAAAAAYSQGADIVEIDVGTTADGTPVLMHDATLERTTDGSGPLSASNYGAVASLDAGGWFDPWYRGEAVPTLAAFLDAVPRGKRTFVELKRADAPTVVAEVRSRNLVDRTMFWAEDPALLRALRDQGDDLLLMIPRTDVDSIEVALDGWQAAIVQFLDDELDRTEIDRCRAAGAQVMAWVPGDDCAGIAHALSFRPDIINTDRPDIVRRILERRTAG